MMATLIVAAGYGWLWTLIVILARRWRRAEADVVKLSALLHEGLSHVSKLDQQVQAYRAVAQEFGYRADMTWVDISPTEVRLDVHVHPIAPDTEPTPLVPPGAQVH